MIRWFRQARARRLNPLASLAGGGAGAGFSIADKLARAGALSVGALGAAVMAGWFLDIGALKSLLPGLAAMKVNTGCSFAAAGVALWLLQAGSPRAQTLQLARVLGVFVAMLAAAALAEGVFGLYLGIDRLILSGGTVHLAPARMSPAMALCFLCSGLALLTLKAREDRLAVCSQWVVLAPLAISAAALVGIAYGVPLPTASNRFAPLAPQVAVLFFMFSLSVLATDRTRGFTGIAASDTAGGAVYRRLLGVVPLVLFALGWAHVKAVEAGMFGYRFAFASTVAAGIAACAIAVAWAALALHRTDLVRKAAMAQIRALNERLDKQEEERKRQLAQSMAELSAANKQLEKLSQHDGLTGVANRAYFDKYLESQIAIARRHNRSVALVLCDVDAFKAYNDHYGHQAGDDCLKQVALALQSCSKRTADVVARYGGEEFAIILPETEVRGATRVAEAARQAVAQLKLRHEYSPAGPHVSISGGVAATVWQGETTAKLLVAAADKLLYEAKHLGRNRMIAARPAAA